MPSNNRLRVASLGSGSKGNATVVSNGEVTVMVDCGFTVKEVLKRLPRIDLQPEQIDGILVTHEHQDHISGVGALSRKFSIPVWATRGSLLSGKCGNLPHCNIIEGFNPFSIGSLNITPLSVPHDAREPCQFLFTQDQVRLAILTDLGCFTPKIVEQLTPCHGILLECNHDEEMLWNGPYPDRLKQRVAGRMGHMSNRQAIELLQQMEREALQLVIATHLSEQNNCPKLVSELLAEALNWPLEKVKIAQQDKGFDWHEVCST
ncbi:MBL fold metallo-hydrolase [Kangiella sp.]|uniref:MBL fold metallo-hydrolase n=1 Tax=Kangiella sp. TaxID=1920245 RepID=UPI00198F7B29|nr:MBL fold metallo-hydrolase [Kangiella sp.]MBD3653651.1 MBL fold metallo-hydrolase [Kangiella sp.]